MKPTTPAPPHLEHASPAFASPTCVDGVVFASGASLPPKMRLLSTVLEPTDERADLVLRGTCAVHEALLACKAPDESAAPPALVIGLDVDAQGKVLEATPQDGPLREGAFSDCVSAALRSAIFPKGAHGKALVRVALATRVVTITESDPWIAGVSPGETKRIFRANFPRLRACYELAKPTSQGLVTFSITVRADGSFAKVQLDHDDTMADREMLQCMAQVMTSLRVPPPPTGQAQIHYRLRFATYTPR